MTIFHETLTDSEFQLDFPLSLVSTTLISSFELTGMGHNTPKWALLVRDDGRQSGNGIDGDEDRLSVFEEILQRMIVFLFIFKSFHGLVNFSFHPSFLAVIPDVDLWKKDFLKFLSLFDSPSGA